MEQVTGNSIWLYLFVSGCCGLGFAIIFAYLQNRRSWFGQEEDFKFTRDKWDIIQNFYGSLDKRLERLERVSGEIQQNFYIAFDRRLRNDYVEKERRRILQED